MLTTNTGIRVNMTNIITSMLALGIAAQDKLDAGQPISRGELKNIQRRNNFLRPLKEIKCQPDPNGRSCNGAFSIAARAHLKGRS
jgi:hypothetical protein